LSNLPDAEASARWMEALAHGSDAALDSLIEAWEAPLHRFIRRYVQEDTAAGDLTQETFVRIYQNRARYQPGTVFAAWAFTIAANLCRNHRRWRWRHRAEPLDRDDAHGSPHVQVSAAAGPDEQLVSAETSRAVLAAIEALPADQRLTVLLFEFDELSYRDVAVIVGCSERGIETRLARARVRLRASLGSLWQEILGEVRVQ
jgi:RNA polymerase sigma-70 factor, ECF subfamily